jgi:crotonobetainyl-CoA:carnitine CoA-transferase CaiB-like acyl-CoA transferase
MKLDGLRVLDLGTYLPTPLITQMMADHGAIVISVEPPGGQPTRTLAGLGPDGQSLWFKATHRGKRSIMLDLKTPDGRAILTTLADEADVFIESYRPGVAARLGIDAVTLRTRNPRLVYCSLSAFGQSGPLSALPGHDMAAQAYTGFLALNGHPGALPAVPGAPAADMLSGMTAFSAILMALYRRESTGRGDAIDVSMYDSLLAWAPHFLSFIQTDRTSAPARIADAITGSAFYNVYRTRDGKAVALAGPEAHYVRNLLRAVEREDLIPAALSDPGPEQDRVIAVFRALFAERDLADWCAFLGGLDVSWAPVLSMVEAFDHPHARAREVLVTYGESGVIPGTPLKFAEEPGSIARRAPALDEHGPSITKRGFA